MKNIVIIDCGGNILSLRRAISKFNYNANITNDHEEIKKASHIFLPGVGAFKKAMSILEKNNCSHVFDNNPNNRPPLKPVLINDIIE